ncbi:MAG TPA: hypothetical protein VF945_01520 [Polyangia bacterium]
MPLDDELIDDIADRSGTAVDELARVLSAGRTIAELETEYFGGSGEQRAAVWRNGEAIFSTEWREHDAINEALRQLGVRSGLSDEFDALELVRFRRFEDFERATPL